MKLTPEQVVEELVRRAKYQETTLEKDFYYAEKTRAMAATVSELIADNKRLREAGNALVESWRTSTEDDDMRTALKKWEKATTP